MSYTFVGIALASLFVGLLLSFQPQNGGAWVAIGNLQSSRSGACSVQLGDGRVLITGGEGSSGVLNTAELFDSNGNFTNAPTMLSSHAEHVCALLTDGRVLVAAGRLTGSTPSNIAEVFDPVKNAWSLAGAMTYARVGATASLSIEQGAQLSCSITNGP